MENKKQGSHVQNGQAKGEQKKGAHHAGNKEKGDFCTSCKMNKSKCGCD